MTLDLMKKMAGYRIESQLGTGGNGVVYLAVDEEGKRAALKVISINDDPDSLAIVEAERLGALMQQKLAEVDSHVPAVYAYERMGDHFYVAMEYVEGRDLHLVQRVQQPSAEEILYYATEIARTLRSAHTCRFQSEDGKAYEGIVHGDIKPGNVRIDTRGRVRILDFGISKALSQTTKLPRNDFGTVAYCSPERLDKGTLEAGDDLWALGVLVYEIAAGRRPFKADNVRELEKLILARLPPPPLPTDVPALIRGFVEKALDPDPAKRFFSADEMLVLLEDSEQGETRRVHRQSPGSTQSQTPSPETLSNQAPDNWDEITAPREGFTPSRSAPEPNQIALKPIQFDMPNEQRQAVRPDLVLPTHPPMPSAPVPLSLQEPILKPQIPLRPSMRLLAAACDRLVSLFPAPLQDQARSLAPFGNRLMRLPLPAHLFFFLLFLLIAESLHYSKGQDFAQGLNNSDPLEYKDLQPFVEDYRKLSFWTPFSARAAKMALTNQLSKCADAIIKDFTAEKFRVRSSDWKEATQLLQELQALKSSKTTLAKLQYCQAQSLRIAAQGRDSAEANQLNQKSIALFNSALEHRPAWPDPHLGLTMLYLYNTGETEKASEELSAFEESGIDLGRRLDYLRGEIERFAAEKLYRELPASYQNRKKAKDKENWWSSLLDTVNKNEDESKDDAAFEQTVETYKRALEHYEEIKGYSDSKQRIAEIKKRLSLMGE